MKTKKRQPPAKAQTPQLRSDGLFPVVGIGASAGGLEALSVMLSRLPSDTGMAFVIIQHLDPTRDSSLPVILQKKTKMKVVQADDGLAVSPNQVYVIPPNSHIAMEDGALRLRPRPKGLYPMAVDTFLISLAEQLGNKAIAVILSGTASDGSIGVTAIKAGGGVVFAQDETSAAHGGMPHSAAATGAVDFILAPDDIAAELARMALHPVLKPDGVAFTEDASLLARIFTLLRRASGVDFSLYKPNTIRRRLLRRLMLHKLERLDQYVRLLEKNAGEVSALHDDLLIHVTHFFREPKTMAVLRAKAFPRIVKGLAPEGPIRAWIPGCSTGEEAYSLAISLLDYMGEHDIPNRLQIFATDISEQALEKARAGVYPESIASDVPQTLLRRFFVKVEGGYQISKRVRDLCVFARQDLTSDPPFGNMDVISCCNVLIYLGPMAQKHVLPMFHYALRPSGALMLGSSETVGEHAALFQPADKKARLYFKKEVAVRPVPVLHPAPRMLREAPKAKPDAQAGWPETDALKVAEHILLARFAPAGVIVNGDLNILHFLGKVNRYLEPSTGRASLTLLKMMPAHSASTVKELIARAKRSDSPVKATGIELSNESKPHETIGIEAVPFRLPISGDRYFIVLFTDELHEEKGRAVARVKGVADRKDLLAVKRLKTELTSTRAYLQNIVEEHEASNEELKSANEEIVSSNEELQSTNEELEITKEELEAANEELNTLNEELQTRNNDLGLVNNDLSNLLGSVDLPIIMVGVDLRIRRFTQAAEKVMNLIPTDVGRPIGDVRPKVPLPNIEDVILDVIESVATKTLEVRDGDRAYMLRVRPYKTIDNKIEGAVLIFLDAETPRRSSSAIKSVSAFEAVLDKVQEPIVLLDPDLRIQAASRSMSKAHGLGKDAVGLSLFVVNGGRWNHTALREALEALSSRGQAFKKLSARIGDENLTFSGHRVDNSAGGPPLILLSVDS